MAAGWLAGWLAENTYVIMWSVGCQLTVPVHSPYTNYILLLGQWAVKGDGREWDEGICEVDLETAPTIGSCFIAFPLCCLGFEWCAVE